VSKRIAVLGWALFVGTLLTAGFLHFRQAVFGAQFTGVTWRMTPGIEEDLGKLYAGDTSSLNYDVTILRDDNAYLLVKHKIARFTDPERVSLLDKRTGEVWHFYVRASDVAQPGKLELGATASPGSELLPERFFSGSGLPQSRKTP
jgi:hypothetical protein